MVLSLDIGKITAQYHVIFNNWFQTIDSNGQPTVDFNHPDWYKTFGLHPWQYIPDDHDDAPLDSAPIASVEGAQRIEDLRCVHDTGPSTQPTRPSRTSFVRPVEPPLADAAVFIFLVICRRHALHLVHQQWLFLTKLNLGLKIFVIQVLSMSVITESVLFRCCDFSRMIQP